MKHCLLALFLFVSINTASAEIYRIEKPDGSVEYTDKKPAGAVESVQEVELPKIDNSNDMRSITRGYDRILKGEEREQAKSNAKAKQRQKALAPLRKKLRKAELALSEGKQKREGDYIRNANGGSRLSPSYMNRMASLETAVNTAEVALQQALRN